MSRHAWIDGGKTVPFGEERIWCGIGPTLLFTHGYPTSSHYCAPIISAAVRFSVLRELPVREDRRAEDDVWDFNRKPRGLRSMPALLHYIVRCERREALVAALGPSTTSTAFVSGMGALAPGDHVIEAVRPCFSDAPIRELGGVDHYPQLEARDEVAAFIDKTTMAWLAGVPA